MTFFLAASLAIKPYIKKAVYHIAAGQNTESASGSLAGFMSVNALWEPAIAGSVP
jgi:hypothetical protein